MTVLYIENAFLFVYSRTIWTNTSGQSGPSTLENDGGKDTGEQVWFIYPQWFSHYRDDSALHRKRFFVCLFQKNLDHVPQDNQDQVLRRMKVVWTLVTEYDTFTLNGSLISVMKLLYIKSTFVVCIFQNDLTKRSYRQAEDSNRQSFCSRPWWSKPAVQLCRNKMCTNLMLCALATYKTKVKKVVDHLHYLQKRRDEKTTTAPKEAQPES